MDAQQQGVEVEAAVGTGDDHLAVEDEPGVGGTHRAQRLFELGEVAVQRLEVARLDVHLGPVPEDEGAEAVPFRLVDPSVAVGDGGRRLGEHRLDGRLDRVGHGSDRTRHAGCIGHTRPPERHPPTWRTHGDRDPVPRRCRLRHRLAVPRHGRRAPGARRLRDVPGFAPGGRAQLPALRLRTGRARRAAADACPPRPLRPGPGAGPGRVSRADPCHARHGRPRGDRAARLGEAAGRVHGALEPPARGCARTRPQRRSSRRPWPRRPTIRRCPSACAPRRPRAEPRSGSRSTTSATSTRRCSRRAAATTTSEVEVTDGVTAVFHDAGHILGSAIIELRVTDGDQRRTIVFSGDLGRDSSRSCAIRRR